MIKKPLTFEEDEKTYDGKFHKLNLDYTKYVKIDGSPPNINDFLPPVYDFQHDKIFNSDLDVLSRVALLFTDYRFITLFQTLLPPIIQNMAIQLFRQIWHRDNIVIPKNSDAKEAREYRTLREEIDSLQLENGKINGENKKLKRKIEELTDKNVIAHLRFDNDALITETIRQKNYIEELKKLIRNQVSIPKLQEKWKKELFGDVGEENRKDDDDEDKKRKSGFSSTRKKNSTKSTKKIEDESDDSDDSDDFGGGGGDDDDDGGDGGMRVKITKSKKQHKKSNKKKEDDDDSDDSDDGDDGNDADDDGGDFKKVQVSTNPQHVKLTRKDEIVFNYNNDDDNDDDSKKLKIQIQQLTEEFEQYKQEKEQYINNWQTHWNQLVTFIWENIKAYDQKSDIDFSLIQKLLAHQQRIYEYQEANAKEIQKLYTEEQNKNQSLEKELGEMKKGLNNVKTFVQSEFPQVIKNMKNLKSFNHDSIINFIKNFREEFNKIDAEKKRQAGNVEDLQIQIEENQKEKMNELLKYQNQATEIQQINTSLKGIINEYKELINGITQIFLTFTTSRKLGTPPIVGSSY